MNFKRLLSIVTICFMIATNSISSFAFEIPKVSLSDEEVVFIVEVEGTPTLVYDEAVNLGAKAFLKTTRAKDAEQKNLRTQSKVVSEIQRNVDSRAKKGFTYTSLFNGFSITAKRSQHEDLKKLPGVKNVFVAGNYKIPKPKSENYESNIFLPNFDDDIEYKGEGRVVAVIDSEFDTNHEFFTQSVNSPKYTKNDIATILTNSNLNINATANQVYKNTKIPFAYDYAQGNADTFNDNTNAVHGTHVAGIVGGKSGSVFHSDKSFSGVAPEVQLILMKIGNNDEEGSLNGAAIFAAINDAAQMGVDAINMSFGMDFIPYEMDIFRYMVTTYARNVGIFISASAGNEARGFIGDVKDTQIHPITEYVDYSPQGTPVGFSSSTAVASAFYATHSSFKYSISFDDETPSLSCKPVASTWTDENSFVNQLYEYVDCGLGYPEDFLGKDLTGKLALVKRGIIPFNDKAYNALFAGASGMVL